MTNKKTSEKIVRVMSLVKNKNGTISAKCESKIKSSLDEITLDNPDKIKHFMDKHFNLTNKSEEYTYMLCLDNKLRLTHIFEVSHGNISSSILSPYQITQRAILTNSQTIVLVHNHPSGNEEPSKADIIITNNIKTACELIGINLVDHIIVTDKYYSMKENHKI